MRKQFDDPILSPEGGEVHERKVDGAGHLA